MSVKSHAIHWLSHSYRQLLQRNRRQTMKRRVRRSPQPNWTSNTELLESRIQLSAATIGTFTGGDVGEGLDLDGEFVYAVNVGGPAAGKVRDANFTSDSVAGFTYSAPKQVTSYTSANFGSTTNDDNLETVMKSIRWSVSPTPVTAQLANLVPGQNYKLQLLFEDQAAARGFDVYIDGAKIAPNFNPGSVQGGKNFNNQGAVITYQFTAFKSTVDIKLDGSATTFSDKNPILNGLTLEHLPPTVTLGAVVNATEGFGFGSTIDGFGKALSIDGTTAGRIDDFQSNPLQLTKTRAYTQEFLLYPKDDGGSGGALYDLYDWWNGVSSLGTIRTTNQGRGLQIGGPAGEQVLSNVLNPDAWNHIAQTYDGTQLQLYVNGVQVLTTKTVPGVQFNDPPQLRLGYEPGAIDELRIWNVARTEAEIQNSMFSTLSGTEKGLVGYWNFNGNLNDVTGKSTGFVQGFFTGNVTYLENAQPQVGSVDVILDSPVTAPTGLFVSYNITGESTALENIDYYSSRFRTVSTDPNSEKRGIIIPQGETKGKIYFIARTDAIFEPTENVSIQLVPFSFASSTYTIGTNNKATVTIADSGAYKPGVGLFDSSGRSFSPDATGVTPFSVIPGSDTLKDLDIALTSQPSGTVQLGFNAGVGNFSISGVLQKTMTLIFTPDNWDQRQRVSLSMKDVRNGSFDKSFISVFQVSGTDSSYLSPVKFAYAPLSKTGEVTEGNDPAPVIPTVQIVKTRDAVEGDFAGGQFHLDLSSPAPSGGLDVAYTYQVSSLTSVGSFSGGDVGEGLDLDGEFLYAIKMNGSSVTRVRDAAFASQNPGVTISAPQANSDYFKADFGSTTNDNNLETVMKSIRYTANPDKVTAQLNYLTPGTEYKLQLLFGEAGSDRGFDVYVDGQKIVPDFNPGNVQGGKDKTNKGAVITYQFVAQKTTADIRLDGSTTPFADKNPILNGLTLEELPTTIFSVPLSGVVHFPEGVMSEDLGIVVANDNIANPSRTLTVKLADNRTTFIPQDGHDSASLQILDDDKPQIQVSNFAENSLSSQESEPNNTMSTPTELGVVRAGVKVSGRINAAGDNDYYHFTFDRSQSNIDRIGLTSADASKLTLVIFDSRGNRIETSTAPNGVTSLSVSPDTSGNEYTIQVYGINGATADYDLSFYRTDPNPDVKYSLNNDTQNNATDLGTVGLGVVVQAVLKQSAYQPTNNDVDYYQFRLDDSVAIMHAVAITFPATQPLSVTLYDGAGNVIDSSSLVTENNGQGSLVLGLGSAVKRGNGGYFLKIAGQGSLPPSVAYQIEFQGQNPFNPNGGSFSGSYSPVVVQESANAPVSKPLGLRLSTQPLTPVTLKLTTASTGTTDAATISASSLTFTPDNWNQYQILAVIPIDDLLVDGDQTLTITATASSSDPSYSGKILTFTAIVQNNDLAATPPVQSRPQDPSLPQVILTNVASTFSENASASTTSFTVALSKPVSTDTYVGVTFDDGTAASTQDFTTSANFARDYHAIDGGATGINLPAGSSAPAFADINGDGLVDMFVGSASGPVQFYLNTGTKLLPKFELQTGVKDPLNGLGTDLLGGYTHPALADVNGDGKYDLLIGSKTGLTYYRNDGTTTSPKFVQVALANSPLSAASTLSGAYFAPTFGDLNGDGKPDLFVPRQGSTTATYFENNGNGQFVRNDAANPVAQLGFGTNDRPTLAFADLNGDGVLDVIASLSTGHFARLNQGTKTKPEIQSTGFSRFRIVTADVLGASWTVADLDNDGVAELVAGTRAGDLRTFAAYQAVVIPAGSTRGTVTLKSVDDLIAEGDETVGIRVLESPYYILTENHDGVQHDITDTYDANQNGNKTEVLPGIYAATITLTDNDTAGFITQAADTTITENGKSVPLNIKLATQPVSNVTVYIGSSDATAGLIAASGTTTATGTLTFTPTNWNVFQTAIVTPVQDNIAYGTRNFNVLVSSASDDVPYRQLKAPLISYQTIDNDTASIIVSGPQDTVPGQTNVIGVRLNTQPVGEVRVTLTPDNSQVRLGQQQAGDPVTLVFNPINWSLVQEVQVTAADDGFAEYVHKSQISFSVETGRKIDGATVANISTYSQAYDLGTMTGGITWTNFPLNQTLQPGAWFKFKLATKGDTSDTIRAIAPDFSPTDTVTMGLYDTLGKPILDSSGKPITGTVVPAARDNFGTMTASAYSLLSLNGLHDGEYLIKLQGQLSDTRGFTFAFDSPDRQFEKLTLKPIDFSIADNDVPTATVVAGPSASELNSTPSYFAVKLNAPASAAPGNAGIRVNFQITGGRATYGDATSLLHDYNVVADYFDPTTGKGYVRVAPGDVQANIGIIPVDDKLVEDLPLTLSQFQYNPTQGYIVRVGVDSTIGDLQNSAFNPIVLKKGTVMNATLPNGREISFTVRDDTPLNRGVYGTAAGGLRVEYAAGVPVDSTQDVYAAATAAGFKTEYPGRVKSEDVQLRILPGNGYTLPLAPDKQNLNPKDPTVQSDLTNFDAARTAANLIIVDDDVPGIQVTRVGDDGNLAEGDTATYAVSLTSEPSQDVTVTLTPDGQIAFVNPANSGTGTTNPPSYSLQTTNIPSNLEVLLGSVTKTNLGWTATLDARLRSSAYDGNNVNLKVSDSTTGNGDQATFDIPAAGATDAAGNPLVGNWNQYQHLVVSNLTPLSQNGDYFELNLTFKGVTSKVRIDVKAGTTSLAVTTTQLTFKTNEWYIPQQIVVKAIPNSIAEPGDWHEGLIKAKFTKGDGIWTNSTIPDAVIHLADQQLQGGETAQALETGFGVLHDSLDSVKLPLVGNLLTAAPELGNFFDQSLSPLLTALKSQDSLSVTELQKISQSATVLKTVTSQNSNAFAGIQTISPNVAAIDLGSGGFLDEFTVEPAATDDQVTLHLTMEKTWHLGNLNLSSDIGLDALGLTLQTEGSLVADVTFKLDFVLGLSRTFGFFIDTAATGLDVDAAVKLDGFQGTGGLGFLKLEFADNPDNPSALSMHFHAGLNDLDNTQTIRFLDVNGDGLLQSGKFVTGIGKDAVNNQTNQPGADGLLDLNAEGQPDLIAKTVAEPFQNVNAQGIPVNQSGQASDFPTVNSLKGTPLADAANVNWNGNNTFDEAVSITNEGVYRTTTLNGKTIIYFDANNNGKLDIGKRNVDPYNTSWTSLAPTATTKDYKDTSEIWIAAGTKRWTTPQGLVNPFQIQSKVSGTATTYYFDANGDGILQPNEQISDRLRKDLDKNKNGILDPNVTKDGEGTFIQGTGIAFADANGNGLLDPGEKFVNSGFGDTTFPEAGPEGYAGVSGPIVVKNNGAGTDYIDLNGNGLDSLDPQAKEGEPITVPEKVGNKSLFLTVNIAKDTRGKRFLDFNGDGIREVPNNPADLIEVYIDDIDPSTKQTLAQRYHMAEGATIPATATTPASVVSFTFFDADGNGKLSGKDFSVLVSEGKRYIDLDFSGTLTTTEEGAVAEPFAIQNNTFDLTKLQDANGKTNGKVIQLLNDGDRLTLKELLNYTRQVRAQSSQRNDQLTAEQSLFNYSFSGEANLGLQAKTSIDGNEAFPSFSFELAVNFPLFNYSNQKEAADTGFTVDLNNVTMDLGTFLQNFVEPILNTVDEILTPIKPIVKVLNADTKFLDAIGLASLFESDGRPGVSLLEIARTLTKDEAKKQQIDKAIKFAGTIAQIIDLVDSLKSTISSGDNTEINFGDFALNLKAASDDVANSASHARETMLANGQTSAGVSMVSSTGAATPLTQASGQAEQTAMINQAQKKSNLFSKLKNLDGFQFNLFNPDTVMSLIMGEPAVDIVTYQVPSFNFDFEMKNSFRIWGPLAGLLQGGFKVETNISVGFDTAGVDEWKNDGFDPGKAYEVFDGFYVNDRSASGVDVNELQVNAFIAVGAGLDLGIVSGFVRGGVRGNIGLDLIDSGERSGESDGKVRGSDIISAFSHNPLDLFALNGTIEAFLGAIVEVDFFFFSEVVYEKDFATFKLAEFRLDSSGFSGSSDFGKAQGGPISGGFVWLDANNNGEFDTGEPSTISDRDGNYQLIIPQGYDTGSGVVRIRGGVDVTTGIAQTTTMSDHLGESVTTPFTSLAEQVAATPVDPTLIDFDNSGVVDQDDVSKFYELFGQNSLIVDLNKDNVVDDRDVRLFEVFYEIVQQGNVPTLKQAEELILLNNGLDPDIDVSSYTHFDSSLANDPTAEAAMLKVDSLESTVIGLKSFLAGAAGVANDDPMTETILTDAVYHAIALQIVTGHTDLSDPATMLAIINDAILFSNAGLMRAGFTSRIDTTVFGTGLSAVAQVLAEDTIAMRLLAAKATNNVELMAMITKDKLSVETGQTNDLYQFGQGQLSEGDLLNRDARIDNAELDRISHLTLPPEIKVIPDFHLLEDQSVSDFHFVAFDLDTPNSALKTKVTSDNPSLIPASNVSIVPQSGLTDWVLNFSPLANTYGQAHITLTLTDESGNSTSETITVIVDPVDHAPVAQNDVINSTGNFAVTFDPRKNDSDSDGNSLSATVLDQPAHGQILENSDGTFTYVANTGFNGVDTATYTVSDGHNGVATATMTFNVAGDLTAQFVNPVADSRNTTLNSVDVAFSRPIDGKTLSIADFKLTRNGQIVPLTRTQTVTFVSGTTYRIGNLAALTRQQGNYELSVITRGISDTSGHPGTTTVSEHWLMDTVAPSSRVNPLPAYTKSLTLQVSWGGTDAAGGSGLVKYDIYVSDNGKPYTRWLTDTVETSHTFDVEDGHTYRFISVATDRAGNSEVFKPASAARTLIDITPPTSSVRALPSIIATTSFVIAWGGNDGAAGSGIATYDVYVSDNGGSFQAIAIGTTKTSTRFTGVAGHQYEFYSVATDLAGNRQLTPLRANTKTTIRR